MGALVFVREKAGATAASAVRQELSRHGDIIDGAPNSGRYDVRIASGDVQPGEGVAFLAAKLDEVFADWRDQIDFQA